MLLGAARMHAMKQIISDQRHCAVIHCLSASVSTMSIETILWPPGQLTTKTEFPEKSAHAHAQTVVLRNEYM